MDARNPATSQRCGLAHRLSMATAHRVPTVPQTTVPAPAPISTPSLTDLPDEVVARIFAALLHTSPDSNTFDRRCAQRAPDALALACASRRTWRAFSLCLSSIHMGTLDARQLRLLALAAGPRLRQLTFADKLPPTLRKPRGAAKLLRVLASRCLMLEDLRFDARALCVAERSGLDEQRRAFIVIAERLTKLAAYACDAADMWTVCEADYSRLRTLVLTVQNSYEASQQLSKLWTNVGQRLEDLELGVVDSSLGVRAFYPIVGDGLQSFHDLHARNLTLRRVCFVALNIRAFAVAHRLLAEPPNNALRVVELRSCVVWPLLVQKLADNAELISLSFEYCRIDEGDVANIVRTSGGKLKSFWCNMGHWTDGEQLQAVHACPNVTKLDLTCRYDNALPNVLNICRAPLGSMLREVRVGGRGFCGDNVVTIAKSLPHLRRINILAVRMGRSHVEELMQAVACRMESLCFDAVQGDWHVGHLLELVRNHTPQLSYIAFPGKLRDNIPVPEHLSQREQNDVRTELCEQYVDTIQGCRNLDIDALRLALTLVSTD